MTIADLLHQQHRIDGVVAHDPEILITIEVRTAGAPGWLDRAVMHMPRLLDMDVRSINANPAELLAAHELVQATGATPQNIRITPAEHRRVAIETYASMHECTIREVAARAAIHEGDLRKWRAGQLPDGSVKALRIEKLIQYDLRAG